MIKKLKMVRFLPQDAVYDEMASPIGTLIIITSAAGLHGVLWDHEKIPATLCQSQNESTIIQTKRQLNEYFEGKRKTFNLPLILNGTDFQIQTWQQLSKIPYGITISYAKQAENIGNKNKARAVGLANGCNPISIIIPCHRVIGSNGTLTGFGGGLDKKAYLLELERLNSN